ncbi:ParB/RepB/Spo0J family partition protein [Haematobacter genomosp. 1]|uniref:ParB/RepB/Spo0J family partition protein n=1 Tax=Haematobacter genomosp. 1 TaxID=366618 RepID=UPI00211AB68C|nr:ParB/RepB/Spo0J family partition protein [Haematobacter genomosp. 1]
MTAADRSSARFLKRAHTLGEMSEREEKVLRWVDPAQCVMWARHNRAYDLLTAENCRDLIDSIRAQGQQEFPAIVRSLDDGRYEVICGARRHFAISWLRANNYPNFRYLVEVRDLSDEEAFRLADIENRDREDLSDFERARDYAQALNLYYGGRQKAMAERLEVSEGWLSRYLQLARLPDAIVRAFGSLRDIKELHARALRPLLAEPEAEARVLAEAAVLEAAKGQGVAVPAPEVINRLKAAGRPPKVPPEPLIFRRNPHESGVKMVETARKITLEFSPSLTEAGLRAALDQMLAHRYTKG